MTRPAKIFESWKNRALMGFTPIVDARKQIVGLLMRHEKARPLQGES
jgi:hypothetical protein